MHIDNIKRMRMIADDMEEIAGKIKGRHRQDAMVLVGDLAFLRTLADYYSELNRITQAG